MKRLMVLFILIMIVVVGLKAENELLKDRYKKAITAYNTKNFEKALNHFKFIENQSVKQADLFYNIGNCYYRLNNLGYAVLYYKRALRLDPLHEQAKKNLKLMYSLREDKTVEKDKSFIVKTAHNIYRKISINLIAVLLLVDFALIVILIDIIIIRFRNRDKSTPVLFITIFLVLFVAFAIVGYTKWNSYANNNEAVIVAKTAIAYSGPAEDYQRKFTIHQGMDFKIVKKLDQWCQIKLRNGWSGWIKSSLFKKVVKE